MTRRGAAGAAVLAAATAALFFVSRGKWSDPLIDSGREWIVPDALARGDLLYRDVVYWFGPFTPYFQALFLGVGGSGFGSLVFAGALVSLCTLALLFVATRRVTGVREAALWTALAVPTLVFMPNAGGGLLGMGYRIWQAAAFALAAVAIAARGRSRGSWMLGAGACAGLSGLCRTEWGLASLAAVALAALLRSRDRRRGLRGAAAAGAGFAGVFGGGLGIFLGAAGRSAVIEDGHVLLTGLPEETRHFLAAFSGIADWRRGILELAYSAAVWTGLFLLAGILARPSGRSPGRMLRWLGVVLAVLAVSALAGGAGNAVLFSAAPLICLASLLAGIARGHGSRAAALSALGLLGLLLSFRRPFHIGDSAYVAPPLLFALGSAAGLLHLAAASQRRADARGPLRAAWRLTAASLVVAALAGRAWQYSSIEGVPIPGTSAMLTARPELAREIAELAASIRRQTPAESGLVVFPEGEILNFLSGRRNPIRHKLYLPGYLTESNEPAVLAELERARPASIVLWRRPVTEYARSLFGEDYGRRLRAWIGRNYRLVPFRASGEPARANARFTLALRNDGPAEGAAPLRRDGPS